MRCGVVWCGVVWCGVWCGVVWCGVVWCGVVWCGVVWCGVVWCGVVYVSPPSDSLFRPSVRPSVRTSIRPSVLPFGISPHFEDLFRLSLRALRPGMVVLRVPENGYDLDDQDVGCSWEELVVKQHRGDFGEITKEDLEVGDTLAMLDRNCITEEFVRRVFVLAATEEDVIVFDEHGQPIDEPGDFVEGGWQLLHGDHSFMEEWTGTEDGYYQLGVPEAPAHAPAPAAPELTPAAAAAAATIAATVAAIKNRDVRIQESFKMNGEDTDGKWFGGRVVAVGEDSCLIGLDDGDICVQSNEEIKGLAEMGRLMLLQDTRGLVADEWQVNQALATSTIRIKEKHHPVGLLLGDGVSSLCGKPVYSSHHLSLPLLESVYTSLQSRPTRGAGGAGDDKRGGLATLRHGDIVISTGAAGADTGAAGPASEIIYSLMNFEHP